MAGLELLSSPAERRTELKARHVTVAIVALALGAAAPAQSVLFDFESGQFTGTPLDQLSGGVRAHIVGTGSGYSIQNIAQVIGLYPTGFSDLGLSPNSVFAADLLISFSNQTTGTPLSLTDFGILAAPQELACDSSATLRISAYNGASLVGFADRTAPVLDTYMWPTIDVNFSSAQPFDNVVVHFQAPPPTGGDYGVIFVADNMNITLAAVPEPLSVLEIGAGLVTLASLRRRRHA